MLNGFLVATEALLITSEDAGGGGRLKLCRRSSMRLVVDGWPPRACAQIGSAMVASIASNAWQCTSRKKREIQQRKCRAERPTEAPWQTTVLMQKIRPQTDGFSLI